MTSLCKHPDKNHKLCSGGCEKECQRMKREPILWGTILKDKKDIKVTFGKKEIKSD